MKPLSGLQQLGRALMLPIAVLPVAGLLLRLGQDDIQQFVDKTFHLSWLHLQFLAAAGGAVFDNLGLLFAIGVAVGFARENHGAAGLAGVVCYVVATIGAKSLIHVPPDQLAAFTGDARNYADEHLKTGKIAEVSVPIGILSGVIAGHFYNWFHNIRLPEYLAFFGGRRFVPIVSGLAGAALAGVFGFGFPWLAAGLNNLSQGLATSGDFGLFAYGFFNRLLIVTGLHHILNNVVWFILGDFHGATGDLKRFFAGDPTAGSFMAGFFPVMMFGLPAACLAMYRAAPPERRKSVGGMLFSMALTSFLTGVTEPIEFTFMFLAPLLFLVHALLTGLSMAVMHVLNIKLGFSFSAGLLDYLLNFNKATNPLLLIPVGLAYFALYYAVFRAVIGVFKLKTPGRDVEDAAEAAAPVKADDRLDGMIAALGGAENLVTIDACTTRLRLTVKDSKAADEAALKRLGAKGVVRPSATALQVVLGPDADRIAGELRARLAVPRASAEPKASAPAAPAPAQAAPLAAADVIAALGGRSNVSEVAPGSSRVLAKVRDAAAVDAGKLSALGARAIARPAPDSVHLIVGPGADALAQAIGALL
jgi:PTS system N-acetylglucosamine-specific IIC component